MERVLTQEERIKRAEEIYLRRRGRIEPRLSYRRENLDNTQKETSNKIRILKRIALQIIICLLLYCIFYLIYDTNYSFSEQTINKINEILNYDVNLNFIYKNINDFTMSIFSKDNETEENKLIENEVIEQKTEKENVEEHVENNETLEQTSENVIINNMTETENEKEENSNDKYSIIIPVNGGYISSRFGAREATSEIMSTNHKGIDIAVPKRNKYLFCDGWKSSDFN